MAGIGWDLAHVGIENERERLQFLDLTDATENDQSLIEQVLYSSDQFLEVPWYTRNSATVDSPEGQDWSGSSYSPNIEPPQDIQENDRAHQGIQGRENENEQCDGQEEGTHPEQVSQQEQMPQGGMFSGHPPTSLPHQAQPMFQMYQMLPSLSNVYVSNVTANVNVHAPYVQPIPAPYGHQIPPQQQQPPPQQLFSHATPENNDQGTRSRRQRQKTDKKREGSFVQTNDVLSPSVDGHPPPQFRNIPPMAPYYLSGAPGGPVYMQHALLPVYPSPMFTPYSHTPGPMVYPHANNIDHGNEEYHDNFHQGGSDMVVMGCPIRSENAPRHSRDNDTSEQNYEVEQEQVVSGAVRLKPESESVQFQGDSAVNQIVQPTLPQQNGEHLENPSKGDLTASNYCRKEQEVEKKIEISKQVTPVEQTNKFLSARNEDPVKFSGETTGETVLQESKPNGELEFVNNVDNISVNNNEGLPIWGTGEDAVHARVPQRDANKTKSTVVSSEESGVASIPATSVTLTSKEPLENSEFPVIGQNVKVRTSSEPEASSGGNQRTQSSGGKSWASLFNRSDQFGLSTTSDNRGRPLARVLPYHETNCSGVSSSDVSPASPGIKQEGVVPSKTKNPQTHEASSSNILNDPYLYNLGAFLCKYELEHKIISLQPRGLTNRSNWCYVNAVLQSLIACPPFYNLLKALSAGVGKKGSNQTLIVDAMVEYANEFSPIPANARIGKREKSVRNKEDANAVEIVTGPAFEPSGIYKILDKVRGESSFNIEGRQEDAEEFLSCLLNGLNDEMFELMKMVGGNNALGLSNGDANGNVEGSVDDDDTEWNVMGPKNKSSVTRRAVCGKTPISDIFRGQFRSRVQRAGDQSTDTVQPFFTLQLDIEKANSVKDALELFMGKDPLEGVTCSRTHREVEAWTQTTLEDLPLVLILHLKCYDYKSDACSKIIKSVDFQVDLKIDGKLLSNRNKYTGKQRNYKLVAVVYHDGKEASKGHYVTDAYHVGYGCWLRYDDVIVRSVPESHVLKPRAPRVPYLLYYRRADTIGPTK
ncbi:hypothetical protein RUM44_011871 [Polyplax serrata]|uniref:ubiquitinyl hydrolase 1 n=1 Tax=Polyplax serrata TaxID=468196 RepID=A0ABR1B9R1_POLSC